MAFGIQSSNNLYNNIGVRKYSGRVTVPQLFAAKRPILYRASGFDNSPKVSSNKWVCYCQDPTKAITQHIVNEYDWGGFGDMKLYVAGLDGAKKTDMSSGLTVAIKGVRNSNNDSWSYASLRITRSSISTSYINIFSWACIDNVQAQAPGMPIAAWSNDTENFNIENATIYAKEYAYNSGERAGEGYIDGSRWKMVNKWVTVKKGTGGTYLYVASPWGDMRSSYGNASVRGWGIVLEPTNSNPYPV